MTYARLALGLLLFTLAGCTVGPDYTPPDPGSPETWAVAPPVTDGDADLRDWWRSLGDPVLDDLVERAIAGSPDLRLAAARVREARAAHGLAESASWPTVDVAGSASRNRYSGNALFGGGPSPGGENNQFDVGFDASWELDVFGGVRRGVEAARADADAADESGRDARVLLVAEVARNYVALRSYQARLAIAEQNLKSQEETLGLARSRLDAGLSGDLEVSQAQAQVETTRSLPPALAAGIKEASYRLDVLLGLQPGTLDGTFEPATPVPGGAIRGSIGVPAEALRRRPDIRRAERELAAATARVGVAHADLYPRFALNGSFGLESTAVGDLVDASSHRWSVGPFAVRWPIFDAGRVRSGIRVQEARQEQALIAYEKRVLGAYEEVANALVRYARERERREALGRAVEANGRSVARATELWERGLSDFRNVLDSQRALLQVEDQLAQSDAEVATHVIALYKALGGGWDAPQGVASAAP